MLWWRTKLLCFYRPFRCHPFLAWWRKRVRCHDDKCCRVSSRTQCRSTAFLAPAVPYCMSSSILPGILEPSLHKDEDTVQLVTTDESTVDEEEKIASNVAFRRLSARFVSSPFLVMKSFRGQQTSPVRIRFTMNALRNGSFEGRDAHFVENHFSQLIVRGRAASRKWIWKSL